MMETRKDSLSSDQVSVKVPNVEILSPQSLSLTRRKSHDNPGFIVDCDSAFPQNSSELFPSPLSRKSFEVQNSNKLEESKGSIWHQVFAALAGKGIYISLMRRKHHI